MKRINAIFQKGRSWLSSIGFIPDSNSNRGKQPDLQNGSRPLSIVIPTGEMVSVEDHVNTGKIQKMVNKGLKKKLVILVASILKNNGFDLLPSGVSPVEEQIRAECNKTGLECIAMIERPKTAYENTCMILMEKLESESDDERRERHIEQIAEKMTANLAAAQKPLKDKQALERELKRTNQSRQAAETKAAKIADEHYGGFHPIKDPLQKLIKPFVISLATPEGVLVYRAIENMPENILEPFSIGLISVGITGGLLAGCHFLGISFTKKNNIWTRIALGTAVAVLLAAVFYIRFSGEETDFVFVFFNFAFCILVPVLSYLDHKDDIYYIPANEAAKLDKKEGCLKDKIASKEDEAAEKEQRVYDRINAEASLAVKEETDELKDGISVCNKAKGEFTNYKSNRIIKPVTAMYEAAIHEVRVNIMQARKREGLEEVSFENQPIIPLDFDDDNNGGGGGGTASQNGQDQGSIKKSVITVLIAVLSFLSMTGCGGDSPAPLVKEGVYIGDGSIEKKDSAALPAVKDQIAYFFTTLEYEPYANPMSVTRDAVKVRITNIGPTSFPSISVFDLPQGLPRGRMVKSKRRKVQNHFKDEVSEEIKIRSQPQGLPYSYVGACLCEVLVPLSRSKADVKTVLIVSDMILNNPDMGLNMYRVGKRLELDYDSFSGKLDKACPGFEEIDLGGIEITAVYLPSRGNDALARATRDFWTRYISEKGGQIRFLPNLPKSQQKVAKKE